MASALPLCISKLTSLSTCASAVGPWLFPPNQSTGLGWVKGRWRAAFPVLPICLLKHVLTAQLGIQPGADEERAAHLSVERVRLFWRRCESVFEHHRDEVVDSLGGGLRAKFKTLRGGEGLTKDHHRIYVGIYHCLDTVGWGRTYCKCSLTNMALLYRAADLLKKLMLSSSSCHIFT